MRSKILFSIAANFHNPFVLFLVWIYARAITLGTRLSLWRKKEADVGILLLDQTGWGTIEEEEADESIYFQLDHDT